MVYITYKISILIESCEVFILKHDHLTENCYTIQVIQ